MELIRGWVNITQRHQGAVVALGSFDGLHRGHQALIDKTIAQARAIGRPAMMLSFEPLPREYFQAEPPARLTNFRERWRLLERTGLQALVLLHFNARLRNLSGIKFIRLVCEHLQIAGLVVGYDFRFGRDGEANAAFLTSLGTRFGFTVEVIAPVCLGLERVSSSTLRTALSLGRFAEAAQILGRSYTLRGRVVRGEQLGRTLGFPTANIRLKRCSMPLGGIYAVRVWGVDAFVLKGVASLGTRPTVGGVEPWLETFIFDFDGELYGREIEIEFVAPLREEIHFSSLDALVKQMKCDVQCARAILQD